MTGVNSRQTCAEAKHYILQCLSAAHQTVSITHHSLLSKS
jgi:hypothetical protein